MLLIKDETVIICIAGKIASLWRWKLPVATDSVYMIVPSYNKTGGKKLSNYCNFNG